MERLLASKSVASAAEIDDLYSSAVDALTGGGGATKKMLSALLHCLLSEPPPDDELLLHVVRLLWQLGCSNSGVDVRVAQPTDGSPACPPVGVLILGFAGIGTPSPTR